MKKPPSQLVERLVSISVLAAILPCTSYLNLAYPIARVTLDTSTVVAPRAQVQVPEGSAPRLDTPFCAAACAASGIPSEGSNRPSFPGNFLVLAMQPTPRDTPQKIAALGLTGRSEHRDMHLRCQPED
jgi:hypothetical protein